MPAPPTPTPTSAPTPTFAPLLVPPLDPLVAPVPLVSPSRFARRAFARSLSDRFAPMPAPPLPLPCAFTPAREFPLLSFVPVAPILPLAPAVPVAPVAPRFRARSLARSLLRWSARSCPVARSGEPGRFALSSALPLP